MLANFYGFQIIFIKIYFICKCMTDKYSVKTPAPPCVQTIQLKTFSWNMHVYLTV